MSDWRCWTASLEARSFERLPGFESFSSILGSSRSSWEERSFTSRRLAPRFSGVLLITTHSQDNIVRVNATELRKRLESYFATDGADEVCVLEIPRGGYSPVFSRRKVSAPS